MTESIERASKISSTFGVIRACHRLVQGLLLLLGRLDEAILHLGRGSLGFDQFAIEARDLGLRGSKGGFLVYRDLARGVPFFPEAIFTLLRLTEFSENPVEDVAALLAALLIARQRRQSQYGKDVKNPVGRISGTRCPSPGFFSKIGT